MKIIKHLNDYWVSYVILLLIAFVLVLIFHKNSKYPFSEIDNLSKENMLLSIENNELIRKTDSIKLEIEKTNTTLLYYKKKDSLLQNKSDSLSVKLNHLKLQYEKAINRVEHFNNDSLRKYFSELDY